MRVSLIHNPSAGDEQHSRVQLTRIMRDHGHEIFQYAVGNDDWSAFIEDPGDLVAIAGGDGTVGQVARKLIHHGVPIAVLPMGTANNIARALGVPQSPEEAIAGWSHGQRRKLDVGMAHGPWGRSWFIEGVGLGLFATAMAFLDERDGRSGSKPEDPARKLERDVTALSALARNYPPLDVAGTIDGKPLSGKFLLVAAMNISAVGPNLDLAPNADPGDGLLDFALVREERRDDLTEYFATRLRGGAATPPSEVHRGRVLKLAWSGFDAHIDDTHWRPDGAIDDVQAGIEISVDPGALEVLVPS